MKIVGGSSSVENHAFGQDIIDSVLVVRSNDEEDVYGLTQGER